MKRKYYLNQDYFIDKQNSILILSDQLFQELQTQKVHLFANKYRGYKKITGSVVADVLEVDNFKSAFKAFCHITGLKGPVMNKKYVNAGIDIEPKVIAALRMSFPKYTFETYDPYKYNFDYFENKDEVIGGLPDAYLKEKNLIIEIKTTGIKNYQNWKTFGVPQGYLKQAQTYSYLMGSKNFWIVATFLHDEDYEDTKNYPIKKRIIKSYPFKISDEIVENDLIRIKEWYQKYTHSKTSPPFDEQRDHDLLRYLNCQNPEEYHELIANLKLEGKADLDFYDK